LLLLFDDDEKAEIDEAAYKRGKGADRIICIREREKVKKNF